MSEMRELAKGKVSRSMQLYPRLMLHHASVTILSMIGARCERASKATMQNPDGNPLRASLWLFYVVSTSCELAESAVVVASSDTFVLKTPWSTRGRLLISVIHHHFSVDALPGAQR